MKSNFSVIVLLMAGVLPFHSVAENTKDKATDPQCTKGLRNGHFWKSLSEPAKISFVAGTIEGAQAMLFTAIEDSETAAPFLKSWPFKLTIGETCEMLDGFYSGPKNGRIPIMIALQLINLKVRGLSQADYEAGVEAARTLFE